MHNSPHFDVFIRVCLPFIQTERSTQSFFTLLQIFYFPEFFTILSRLNRTSRSANDNVEIKEFQKLVKTSNFLKNGGKLLKKLKNVILNSLRIRGKRKQAAKSFRNGSKGLKVQIGIFRYRDTAG